MSRPTPPAYKTRNWPACNEALKRGRQPDYSGEEGSENSPGDCFRDDWMHCVKLLGQRLSARDFDRQVAEFRVRVAVLKGLTALGIPTTEAAG